MKAPQLITIAEAAARLGISRRSMQAILAAGLLPAVRISIRIVRIDEDDLARFVARMKSGGRP